MFLLDLLTFPLTGPIKGVCWLAETLTDRAEAEIYDEGRIRSELLDLQARYDMGEINDGEYDRLETILLQRLNVVREANRG